MKFTISFGENEPKKESIRLYTLVSLIDSETFHHDKKSMAMFLTEKELKVEEVRAIIKSANLTFDNEKREFIKKAFLHASSEEKLKYLELLDVFTFTSDKEDLRTFMCNSL